jgi:hypothetical protein
VRESVLQRIDYECVSMMADVFCGGLLPDCTELKRYETLAD